MAAFAALASLKKTIERIQDSPHISLVASSPQIIQLVYKELKRMQEILERLDSTSKCKSRKKINSLDGEIKEALWKFENSLESHLFDQITSQSKSHGGERDALLFSIDLHDLRQDVDFFIMKVKDMRQDYFYELNNLPPEEDEDESIPIRTDFGGLITIKSKMFGFSKLFEDAIKFLIQEGHWNRCYALVGMAGIGKTTLAKEIFEDPSVVSHFECRAGVKVGRKSQFNEILRRILTQVDPNTSNMPTEGNDEIGERLKESLQGKKCLIVLDDVWDTEIIDWLGYYLPNGYNSFLRVLLTTRQRFVAEYVAKYMFGDAIQVMKFLNEGESMDLLREKVFGEEIIPHQLEKPAKKIVKICEGLPLTIVAVADRLSNAEKTLQYWNEVAEKRNSVFMDVLNEICKVLFPSYDYLNQFLKMFFLYMGAFPQDYEIPPSKLVNMLSVEGFIDPYKAETVEGLVASYLEELVEWNNLAISHPKSVGWNKKKFHPMKSCRLHSSWQHLCRGEARKNKFFHVLNSRVDGLEAGKGHRRLCVYNNILFGIKDVYDSLNSDSASSTTRSLICFGPYHQYPVPINVDFKLLRILDSLKLRFYSFPIEVLKLVQLQYLALTYNGNLPSSICKLFNLQFLIVHPHMSIKSSAAQSCIPIQIWDMQALKHIEILGSSLPTPNCAASLEKLSTLIGVTADSCTRAVLTKIPNIRKLGIQVELAPCDDDSNQLMINFFDHISVLENLETLKCSVVNPGVEVTTPLKPLSRFPSRLRKLHLSGTGYPWKYMDVIGSLPNLEVLKLRSYAFQGPKWEIQKSKTGSFPSLVFLLIEDTDLVKWRPRRGSFPRLTYVSMRHCYELEELHWPSDFINGRIELVDCNPIAVTCANRLKLRKEYACLDVIAQYSFLDDGELN